MSEAGVGLAEVWDFYLWAKGIDRELMETLGHGKGFSLQITRIGDNLSSLENHCRRG